MLVGKLIPKSIKSSPLYQKLHPRNLFAGQKTARSVFSNIYEENAWGGKKGDLYSGSGSRGVAANDYVTIIKNFMADHDIQTVLDLGCGDFYIGRQIAEPCAFYTGVDVVPQVVERNQTQYGSDKIEFQCLDITEDALPSADLCLIRQVLQHLSNKQIQSVLNKIGSYKYVIVTEHFPHDDEFKQPNREHFTGSGTRVSHGSAVVLSAPPFNIPMKEIYNIAAPQREDGVIDSYTRGSIRTFLLNPA